MNLADKLGQDYTAAYKARDAVRLAVLRLLKTAISNRLVELKKPGGSLSDEEIIALLQKQSKQRRDSIEQYRRAGRDDLAEQEERELAILSEYLPEQLSEQELAQALTCAISETGAASPADMGKVMKLLLAKYQGRVDGSAASALARQMLSARK